MFTEDQILEMGSALEHSGMSDDEIDTYLEHYGVKGMKWGVRKDRRKANRALNKQSRAKEKAKKAAAFEETRKNLKPTNQSKKYDLNTKEGRKEARKARAADIDRARERISSGAARADRKEARAQYKKDKTEIGSREARKILRAKKNELYSDAARAQETRDGFELANNLLGSIARNLEANKNR